MNPQQQQQLVDILHRINEMQGVQNALIIQIGGDLMTLLHKAGYETEALDLADRFNMAAEVLRQEIK